MIITKFLLFTIALLLLSCSGRTSKIKEIKSFNKTKKLDSNLKTELITEAKSIEGTYITKSYLTNIKKTKSIYESKKMDSQSLFGFSLDLENLKSSSPFLYGYLVHEGGYDSPIIFDSLKKRFIYYESLKNEFDNEKDIFEINHKQNDIELYFPNTHKNEIYKKVIPDIETELRQILIEGNYLDADKRSIIFKKNGDVLNFKDYVFFEVIYDFSLGIQFDAVIFFKSKEGGNWSHGDIYKFEISNDTLNLNFVQTNWDNLEHNIESKTIALKKY